MRLNELFKQPMIGYKVMKIENGQLVAGADSRQSFPSTIGKTINMSGNGIYLGTNKQYVLMYYSGLAEEEALLTFEFDPSDITTGNLEDKEVEISVKTATLIDIEVLDD